MCSVTIKGLCITQSCGDGSNIYVTILCESFTEVIAKHEVTILKVLEESHVQ